MIRKTKMNKTMEKNEFKEIVIDDYIHKLLEIYAEELDCTVSEALGVVIENPDIKNQSLDRSIKKINSISEQIRKEHEVYDIDLITKTLRDLWIKLSFLKKED